MRCIAAMAPSVLQNMPSTESIPFISQTRQLESRHNRMTRASSMASALKIMTIATSLSRIYGSHTGVKLEADFSSAKLGRNVHRIAKQTIFPKFTILVCFPITPLIYDRCLPKAKNTHDP